MERACRGRLSKGEIILVCLPLRLTAVQTVWGGFFIRRSLENFRSLLGLSSVSLVSSRVISGPDILPGIRPALVTRCLAKLRVAVAEKANLWFSQVAHVWSVPNLSLFLVSCALFTVELCYFHNFVHGCSFSFRKNGCVIDFVTKHDSER